jgi:hypothetical protein
MKQIVMSILVLLFAGVMLSCQTSSSSGGGISLFDGKTLTGWDSGGRDGYSVADGAITIDGTSGGTLVYTGTVSAGKFKNFELSLDVKIGGESNSGVLFHTDTELLFDKGFEAQVNNNSDNENKTGSILSHDFEAVIVEKNMVAADTWFKYQIIVKGKKITTKINGKVAAEMILKEEPGSGTFAFQGSDGKVQYKNIKVKSP